MIVPSIDIMQSAAVQLVGGREKVLDAGDPRPLAERFGRVGEVALIDLDAAMGLGSNSEIIRELLSLAPCRVGGGIRDVSTAREWLDAGACRVILGTAAEPEILGQLPPDRVVAALDAVDGEVVVEGWRRGTGRSVADRMTELRGLAGGFLVTFVEREGRMSGTALDRVAELVDLAGPARLTVAGGVSSPAEIAALDRLGADAQVGMAIYTGEMSLAEAFSAPMISDREDGLWPTVVVDEVGKALGLVYSDIESLGQALEQGRGIYRSRTRGLWVKGKTSGNYQDLLAVNADCDRDTLRFKVRQHGSGFCHLGGRSCWRGDGGLAGLVRLLAGRVKAAPKGSYTGRLLSDKILLEAKLVEEAKELAEASSAKQVAWEAADVLYFTSVALARSGVGLDEVEAELDRRRMLVSRRAGDAKIEKEDAS
jgi:phosphoribosyl-AMP cyclohydrolase / phosphoribosyl-ATP pyrophosphohydrolase